MKNIWKIFTGDVRNITTNWVVAIVIGGLILLPSLYAWFNIKASWDPYSQTDQIPIGLVNEDKGTDVRGEDIHVGNDLVDTLKENDSFEWHFDKRKEALDELEYGNYYAVIIIPEDFSEKLGSVITDIPEKATIDYYVNEKINAIAPKITGKGASVIVEEVGSQFVATVNGVIFEMFNDIGLELEKDLPDIKQFEEYVFTLEKKLPGIKETLDDSQKDANKAEDVLGKAKKAIPEVEKITANSLQQINEANDVLQKAEKRWNELNPIITNDLQKVDKTLKHVDDYLVKINNSEIDLDKGKQLVENVNGKLTKAIETIDTIVQGLEQINKQNPANQEQINSTHETVEKKLQDISEQIGQNEAPGQQDAKQTVDGLISQLENRDPSQTPQVSVEKTIEQLRALQKELQEIQTKTNELANTLDEKQEDIDKTFREIKEKTGTTIQRLDKFNKEFNEKVIPTVDRSVKEAKTTMANAKNILTDVNKAIPKVKEMLAEATKKIESGQKSLTKASNSYPAVHHKVNELAKRIRELNEEADINEIITLLQNNPEAEESFFAEPVVLEENKVFPIENYGTGMTPFYTVLAIWVGGLLLISIVATDGHHLENYTFREAYFGRLFTFLTISLLQTIIVTVGDLYPIGVTAQNPVWFVIFGLFISLVFMTIIYSFVSVFGDIGKAMAIVLLVLQIAGSGGTYPVVLLPEFFQKINPFLPFTYAVGLMREAIGGIVWERAIHDLLFLFAFAVIMIVFSAFLKGIINKQSKQIKEKSKESGLFH